MANDFDKIDALESGAGARGLKDTSPAEAIANAPKGPAFLEEADRRRAELAKDGGSVQDLIDAVMTSPGDLKSWTEDLTKRANGNMDVDEARGRIRTAIGWYSRRKKLIQEGERQKLVDA